MSTICSTVLNPVLGEGLEDGAHHDAELECQRSALPQEALLNPVQCERLEDLHDNAHEHRELELEC